MVETGGEVAVGFVGDVDGAPSADAVGEDRNQDRREHEEDAPGPGAEADVRDESAIGDHGDQELHARAGLGHLEIAVRDGDEDAFDMRGYANDGEQGHADLGSDELHHRHHLLADRNEEKCVEYRKGERARDRLAEAGDHGPLQHQHEAGMAGERDHGRLPEQPAERACRDEEQPRTPSGGGELAELGQALPHQPADDRQDQGAVIVGGAFHPDAPHVEPIMVEEQQDGRSGDAKAGQMGAPAARRERGRLRGSIYGEVHRHAAARRCR
jgi:hypothetical protein